METKALQEARQQVAELESEMLKDITTKAELLGYTLVKDGEKPEPKQKRKRRTRAEIEAESCAQD